MNEIPETENTTKEMVAIDSHDVRSICQKMSKM